MSLLILGSSHAFFMAQCLGDFSRQWEDVIEGPLPILAPSGAVAGHLLLGSPRSSLFRFRQEGGRTLAALDERYRAHLVTLDHADTTCLLAIGGNEHNSLFMQRHAVPFDFFHEIWPPLLPARQIVPRAAVAAALREALAPTAQQLDEVRNAVRHMRLAFVAPPPPIPSAEHILGLPEAFDFSARPLEDKGLRLKVYALYLDELAAVCRTAGVPLLGPPPATRDAAGFLAEPYWNWATHAQPAYYADVFSTLETAA